MVCATCLVVLVAVTRWVSRPSIPFKFLEGAELESEHVWSRFQKGSGLTGPEAHYTAYRLRESHGTVSTYEKVIRALRQAGYARDLNGFRYRCLAPRSQSVAVYQLTDGFVVVTVISEASLFDEWRCRLGLCKQSVPPRWL